MPQPNIILMITDDQTFESISRMQGLFSRIAKNGVFFSNMYTSTALCQPGRAILQTGQFAHNNGVINNEISYTTLDEDTLLGKLLKDVGYNTGYVGKYMNSWVSTDPIPAGYDEWHVSAPQDAYNYNINDNGVVTVKGSAPNDHHTIVTTDRALNFISSAVEPFFLGVGFNAPHFDGGSRFNVTPPVDYIGTVPAAKEFEKFPDWNIANVSNKPDYIQALAQITPGEEAILNNFWREVTESLFGVSKAINQIIDALVAAGKYDNTYIVFVADNGAMYGEQRIQTGKIVPYETSIHIPLVISGPAASVARNTTCSQFVTHVDIAPTILELAEATSPLTIDGISLVPFLVNPLADPIRDYVFIEWTGGVGLIGNPIYRAVRSADWKYIEYDTGEKELYDLANDPWEQFNVVSLPANAALVATFSAAIAQRSTCVGAACNA